MCEVVHIKDGYDVYGGRAGHGHDGYFGNPYSMHLSPDDPFYAKDRTDAIAKFREYAFRRFNVDMEYRERVLSLHGKRIGCFCKPKSCHCDVYVELVARNINPLFGGM